MTQQDLIYVCGYYASGKSTLMRLLDGHPQLGVLPIHDRFDFLLNDNFVHWSDDEFPDIKGLKKELTRGGYYNIQELDHGRDFKQAVSKDVKKAAFERFDYYEFEKDWMTKLASSRDFTGKNVIDCILDSFFNCWPQYDSSSIEYYVGMGGPTIEEVDNLIESYDDSKIIFIERDPRGIIATLGEREFRERTTSEILRDEEMYKIKRLFFDIRNLEKRYPNRIHIMDFEDLIMDTESTMEKVQSFLNINRDPILKTPSFCGDELEKYNEKYIGNIDDDWEKIMTQRQKDIANLQYNGLRDAVSPPSAYRPASLAGFLTMRCKNLLKNHVRKTGENIYHKIV